MHEVILAPEAQEFFAAADAPLAKKLARCFEQLERDTRKHANIKRLTGEFTGEFTGYRRYRAGNWRVIYSIDAVHKRVLILAIAHRREVYE